METFWLILGFAAQLVFGARFAIQWIASERAGKSVIPVFFWVLSITGGLLLLAYSIYRQDPVFIMGQTCGVFIYGRNLLLIRKERADLAAKASASSKPSTFAEMQGEKA